MAVDTISATSPATDPTAAATSVPTTSTPTIDYNNFLQLLIAEMKNQDPTKPSDPTEMVSQMASFSQVEQQVNANAKLDSLLSAMAVSEAGSLVGRTVTSVDGSTSGIVASVKIVSSGPVAILQDGTQMPVGAGVSVS